jgi:DNA polymerase-1
MQLFSSVSTEEELVSTADDEIGEAVTAATTKDTPKPTPESIEAELQALGIHSRPTGGNWNLEDPVGWSRDFGSRSPSYKERLKGLGLVHLQPGDEGYFDVTGLRVPGITIVRTKEEARIVVEKLNQADPAIFHACDTEVMDIDLKAVGPVGNGYVTCASIYSGPDFDYGLGDGPGTCLWIDNLDDAYDILQEFKGWFENERFLKVWHNYGFDRHVMWNEGINVLGVGGDTMHMARLQDSSRSRLGQGGGYGLEALTNDLVKRRKKPMKEIFGIKRLRKDGSEGALVDMPPVEVMQRDPKHRTKWIEYSCYDAQGTWLIREELQKRLEKVSWYEDKNLYEYYVLHMRPFAAVLTDMERRGIRVDARDYLAGVEKVARADRVRHSRTFREWAATKIGPDGLALNPASSTQLGTLLFGGARNTKTGEFTETVRVFKVPREEIAEEALEAYMQQDEENAKQSDHGKQRCKSSFSILCSILS